LGALLMRVRELGECAILNCGDSGLLARHAIPMPSWKRPRIIHPPGQTLMLAVMHRPDVIVRYHEVAFSPWGKYTSAKPNSVVGPRV
jgi:hypothetical protein